MFDRIFAAVLGQFMLRKHEVCALYRILIRPSVADKNCGCIGRIEKTHHRRFASRTAVPTGLVKVWKFSAPQASACFEATGADATAAQQGRYPSISAREDSANAIVETVTDD